MPEWFQRSGDSMKKLDLVGHKYGLVTVLGEPRRCLGSFSWKCRCDCGAEFTALAGNLRSGKTKSCGCLRDKLAKDRIQHGHARKGAISTEHKTWMAMIQRCTNPNNNRWRHYGARGISVCDRWLKFENFLADMGLRPKGLTLDRKNNDGNYEPGNCRWATASEQQRNKRGSRVHLG